MKSALFPAGISQSPQRLQACVTALAQRGDNEQIASKVHLAGSALVQFSLFTFHFLDESCAFHVVVHFGFGKVTNPDYLFPAVESCHIYRSQSQPCHVARLVQTGSCAICKQVHMVLKQAKMFPISVFVLH